MSSQRTFLCPSCGASLTPRGSQPEITCDFCGATVIVPPELRTQPTMQTPSSPFMPPPQAPQVIIVEQTPPIFINGQQSPYPGGYVPQQQQPYQQRRRRNGCGCGCGCLGPIIGLLVLLVVIMVIFYKQSPGKFSQIIGKVQSMATSFHNSPFTLGMDQASETPEPPWIISFTAAPASVTTGGSTTLVWATNGDTVKLDRLTPPDTRSWTVQAFGSQMYTFSSDTGAVVFRLTITKNGKTLTRNVTVNVKRR